MRQDKRELLACKACDAEPVRAPTGDKVVTGGYYGPRLVASLVVGKYWDSLPLNRMRQQFERLGLPIPNSSIGDQITWATELLRPVWLYLMLQTLAATVMHVDATSFPVKDRDHAKGIKLGSLWGHVGDKSTAVILYCRTGKAKGQRMGELGPAATIVIWGPRSAHRLRLRRRRRDLRRQHDARGGGGARLQHARTPLFHQSAGGWRQARGHPH